MTVHIPIRLLVHLVAGGASLLCSSASNVALAEQARAPLNVSASISGTCSVQSQPDIDFGTITSPTTDLSNNIQVTVTCVGGISTYGIWIPLSSNASGSQRRMANTSSNGGYLSYDLYADNRFSTSYSTSLVSTGNTSTAGTSNFHQIVGRIVSGQTVSSGDYVDQITVNVSF